MSLNRAILIGNLGRDPDLRALPGGTSVCELSVATHEKYKGKDGAARDEVEWHRVVVWGRQAELCREYLSKGRQVCVEGRIRTRKWERDGQKHAKTEIVADRVRFLGGGRKDGAADGASAASGGAGGLFGEGRAGDPDGLDGDDDGPGGPPF